MTHQTSRAFTWIAGLVIAAITLLGALFLWLIRKVALSVIQPSVPTDAEAYLMDIDYEDHSITFSASESFQIPGRYGVQFGSDRRGYLKIGNILRQDARSVTRELIEVTRGEPKEGTPVWQMSWYYYEPSDLGLFYRDILIKGPVGILPSWIFPKESSTRWAILVHGRGASRSETLRAVPLLHEQGYQVLVMSYRNDGIATPTSSGKYALGNQEWQDLDAVIEYARHEGASELLIMAWSMGAAVTQEYLRHRRGSASIELVSGVIFDSPVVDWHTVLDFHADIAGLNRPVRDGALALLESRWGTALTGAEQPVNFAEMSLLEHPEHLYLPTLILHSDDDHYVPSSSSRELQALQPELVTLVSFDEAQHVRLWNYDEARWQGAIKAWLQQGI